MENEIAKQEAQTVGQYMMLPSVVKSMNATLGNRVNQFTTSVASLASSNSELAKCTPKSLFSACLTAASLNLPINQNLGFAYIVPYNNKKVIVENGKKQEMWVLEAQFQMGYKGFIQLAQRSGQVKTINVSDVKDGELVDFDRLTGEYKFEWISDFEERKKRETIGCVAYFETLTFHKSLYMSIGELKDHGLKFSKSMKKGYGLWKDDFDAMASKTVLKLLLQKYAPMNSEMEKAIISDQAVIRDGDIEYVDNKPITAIEKAEDDEKQRIVKHIEASKTLKELGQCKQAVFDSEDNLLTDQYLCKEELLKGTNDK